MFLAACLSKRSSFVTISAGEKTFEYKGIIVKPRVVLFDKSRKLLSIVERAIGSDLRNPGEIDCLSARISAYVVARTISRLAFRSINVRLYLGYPGNVQTEVEAQLHETARMIREYRRHQHDRTDLSGETIPTVPGQVLAYTFSASPGYAKNAWSHRHG